MDDAYEWQPPTEAELKIIQARRERSDKISKLMGDYLLKGYKMLGVTCPECTTILLQDKQGENYCIACRELDTDTDKDDPVLNVAAARSQIMEGTVQDFSDADELSYMLPLPQATSQSVTRSGTQTTSPAAMSSNRQTTSLVSSTTVTSIEVPSQSNACNVSLNLNFVDTVETLCQKIKWATEELKATNNVDSCIKLCQVIKASAEAVQSLKCAS